MQINRDNNNNSSSSASAASHACAACKYQRRKCDPNCVLAPFLPPNSQNDFLNAHKLFGVSKIKKNITDLHPPQRPIAMKSIIYQANMRANDPVGGCYRYLIDLTKQIDWVTAELQLVNQRLAICKAQAATQVQLGNQEVNPIHDQGYEGNLKNNGYDNDTTMRVHEQQLQCQKAEGGNNFVDQGSVYDLTSSLSQQVYNVLDANSVKVESEASVVPFFLKRDLSDIGEDVKPLLPVFDDKGPGTLAFDSKGPVRLCSDKLVPKEVFGSIQHELKHDLKDAASQLTLTNGKG